jgi:hypothetical protein
MAGGDAAAFAPERQSPVNSTSFSKRAEATSCSDAFMEIVGKWGQAHSQRTPPLDDLNECQVYHHVGIQLPDTSGENFSKLPGKKASALRKEHGRFQIRPIRAKTMAIYVLRAEAELLMSHDVPQFALLAPNIR